MPKYLHTSTEPRLHYSNPDIGFVGGELDPGVVVEAAANPNPAFFEPADDAAPVTWPRSEPEETSAAAVDPAEPEADAVPADIPSASTEEA